MRVAFRESERRSSRFLTSGGPRVTTAMVHAGKHKAPYSPHSLRLSRSPLRPSERHVKSAVRQPGRGGRSRGLFLGPALIRGCSRGTQPISVSERRRSDAQGRRLPETSSCSLAPSGDRPRAPHTLRGREHAACYTVYTHSPSSRANLLPPFYPAPSHTY